jgi:hypothetical protein
MLFRNILFLTYLVLANSNPISFYNYKPRIYRQLNTMTGGEDLGSSHNLRRLNTMTGGNDLGSSHNFRRLNTMTGGEDLGSSHNLRRLNTMTGGVGHSNLRYLGNNIDY